MSPLEIVGPCNGLEIGVVRGGSGSGFVGDGFTFIQLGSWSVVGKQSFLRRQLSRQGLTNDFTTTFDEERISPTFPAPVALLLTRSKGRLWGNRGLHPKTNLLFANRTSPE